MTPRRGSADAGDDEWPADCVDDAGRAARWFYEACTVTPIGCASGFGLGLRPHQRGIPAGELKVRGPMRFSEEYQLEFRDDTELCCAARYYQAAFRPEITPLWPKHRRPSVSCRGLSPRGGADLRAGRRSGPVPGSTALAVCIIGNFIIAMCPGRGR